MALLEEKNPRSPQSPFNLDNLERQHSPGGDGVPGFIRAYNQDRYEELPTWKDSLTFGSGGHSRAVSRSASRAQQSRGHSRNLFETVAGYVTPTLTDHCYTLIKSDVLDDMDFLSEELPEVPTGVERVRQPEPARSIFREVEEVTGGIADSSWFQGLGACVILLSALLIGLETDIRNKEHEKVFRWMENGVLGFFCMELTLRIWTKGVLAYFCLKEEWRWNLFDFCIVASGTFEHWFLPLMQELMTIFHHQQGTSKGERNEALFMVLSVGRFARLLRLARLLKLLRIIRPLYELAVGISCALQGMFWVMVLLAMALYVSALLCEWVIGDEWGFEFGGEFSEEEKVIVQIVSMFKTVDSSMFALFEVLIGWSFAPLTVLFEEVPLFRPFFVLFYVYSAWAMLAIMSGVVSDNMIAIRNALAREDARKDEMRKQKMTQKLLDLFHAADADNSGQISSEEFQAMLVDPEFCDTGKKLLRKIGVDVQDLSNLFEWIDHDDEGEVSIDKFMEGFRWLSTSLCTSTILKCHDRWHIDFFRIKKMVEKTMEERFTEALPLLMRPLEKVNAIKAQLQHLDMTVMRLRNQVEQVQSCLYHTASKEDLHATQERLQAKLQQLAWRLDRIEDRDRHLHDRARISEIRRRI